MLTDIYIYIYIYMCIYSKVDIKTDWVYCAVRPDSLKNYIVSSVRFIPQSHAMVEAFCLPVSQNANERVRSRISPCEIHGGMNGNLMGVSQSTSVFLCQCHSINVPYSSSSTHCSYQKDERVKIGVKNICKWYDIIVNCNWVATRWR